MKRLIVLWITALFIANTAGYAEPLWGNAPVLPDVFLTTNASPQGLLDLYDAIVWNQPSAGVVIETCNADVFDELYCKELIERRNASLADDSVSDDGDTLRIVMTVCEGLASTNKGSSRKKPSSPGNATLYIDQVNQPDAIPVTAFLLASYDPTSLELACGDLRRSFAESAHDVVSLDAMENHLVSMAETSQSKGCYQLIDIDPKE